MSANGPAGCFSARPKPSRGGQKRLRVALLAAAAAPVPPPAADLVPDATLADDLFPEDLPRLLELPAGADLYLQDEVELALHPTLTRVWSRAGRSGQRWVQAPGNNAKQYGFGLSTGATGTWTSPWPRAAAPRRCAPSCARGSTLAVAWQDRHGDLGRPRHPHAKGSRLLWELLVELGGQLALVYTPTYDLDANRIKWLWRALRRAVTHTHQRTSLAELLADAQAWTRSVTLAEVLSQIGSPFTLDHRPVIGEELNHARAWPQRQRALSGRRRSERPTNPMSRQLCGARLRSDP